MKNTLLSLFFFAALSIYAQNHPSCDGVRFQSDVFTEVESTTALKFGEGMTIAGNFQELFLDVYEPVDDMAEKRPLVILAFGGSFIAGERGDLDWLCEAYARKGFVAATIDYRLYDLPLLPIPTADEMKDVVIKSISDFKAAIRYFREDAATDNIYRIDPDWVFIGGISAGAIAASHTAAIDPSDDIPADLLALIDANGGFEGNTSANHQYSSEVQGLVNYSGGLHDASWISADDPPIISVHDDMDGIVPYGEGFASILVFDIIYMEGSLIMHEETDNLGIENQLHTIENSTGHVSYFTAAEDREDIMDMSGLFLHDILCGEISNNYEVGKTPLAIAPFPNPTNADIFFKNEQALPLYFRLFNSVGQELGAWENINSLDLSEYGSGVYFLKIEDMQTNASAMKKVIVNKN